MAKKRSEVEDVKTWDVSSLYKDMQTWRDEFTKTINDKKIFESIQSYKGKLDQSATNLKELLDLSSNFDRKLEKLYVYAHLRLDEEISNQDHKKAHDEIMFFVVKYQTETAWIQPEILKIPKETFEAYLKDESLQLYHLFLKKVLRLKEYTLSENEERLFALGGKALGTSRNTFSLLNNVDLKFPKVLDEHNVEHELTHSLYSLYMQSNDRALRKNAFEAMHYSFGSFENTISELLHGHVQTHVMNKEARGYESCMQSALYQNEIDPSVYQMLLEAASENLEPLHKYISLRKDLLGVDKICGYDMYVPCANDFKYEFSYEEAKQIVIEATEPLGKEYQEILEKGLNEQRWVDPFENESKRSGAYSSGCFDSHPFILMNFQGTLNDVMTLAHEAGHSMHTYFSTKNQPYIYSQYVIFVAEVASTFNEELVFQYLLKKASSEEERSYLIHQKIDGIRATFFRQTLFAEFELEMHKLAESGHPLNAGILKNLYASLCEKYYGKDFQADQFLACEYLRIPHFYSNFYVYQYATGISAALSLADQVLETKDPTKYLEFLSMGCSKDPVALLRHAGVDMATKDPTEKLCKRFESLTKQFESLSNKLLTNG